VMTRKRSEPFAKKALSLLLASSALLSVACEPEREEVPRKGNYTVGLLLPYTGKSAGTANNFERAVLLAAERVNDAGGIDGRKLRIVARDTGSELGRSLRAVDDLIDEGALAVIGPESPEIAEAIMERLNDADVALLSPLVSEGEELDIDCEYPWFRLAPSALSLGENLAKDLASEGYEEVAVLYGEGDYNRAFRAAFVDKFSGVILGGTVIAEESLDEGASTYSSQIETILEASPDAIVLSAAAKTGALVINEAGFLGVDDATWALSPLLKTPLFIQNVESEFVEGALGVAPKIFDRSEAYPNEYAQRWQGDAPLEGAYFYYDAIGLLTISLALLDEKDRANPSYEEVAAAIAQAASTRGEAIGWDNLEVGLKRVQQGIAVSYSGLTGPMVMETCGDRRSGVTRSWTVRDGEIRDILDASEE